MTNSVTRNLLAALAILTVVGGCAATSSDADSQNTVARSNDTKAKKTATDGRRIMEGIDYGNYGFGGLLIW
jgi:hypothetical protein